ncbi:NfeD family protein [Salisaeta longa]|uniref:NfeD family protein n=1 Tax=Salisaeta longa TaxID=503170 RepID=UPI0003B54A7E|nr:NfeD family protein [Salisaeta longa]
MSVDPELLTWGFFLGGLLLMLLETVLPGGVAFFLGIGGLVVSGLRVMGFVVDPLTALLTWLFLSTGLTIALRPLATRYFGGDSVVQLTDEDADAMGQTVDVVEAITPTTPGRIRFRGATWDARTLEGTLPEGAEARIVYRENLTWIVEPTDGSDLDMQYQDALSPDTQPTPSRTPHRSR